MIQESHFSKTACFFSKYPTYKKKDFHNFFSLGILLLISQMDNKSLMA